VAMTPDHKVLTTEGWLNAESARHNRAPVRLPDGHSLPVTGQRPHVADPLRLRQRKENAGQTIYERRLQIVRVHDIENANAGTEWNSKGVASHPRHVASSSLFCLALDESSLPTANTSSLAQLRRPRNHGLRPLAGELREFLGGYGANLSPWT